MQRMRDNDVGIHWDTQPSSCKGYRQKNNFSVGGEWLTLRVRTGTDVTTSGECDRVPDYITASSCEQRYPTPKSP